MNTDERANAGLHPHILERIAALCPNPQARILDVGCGTGVMLRKLAASGYCHLTGLDIAPPGETLDGVRFLACDLDACTTPFEPGSQDLVVSVEVFEHLENLGSLLADIARVLAPEGRLLMTTPNVHSIEARLRWFLLGRLKQFDEIGDPTHITPIFLHAFTRLLRRHALEIDQAWGYPVDGHSPTSRLGLRLLSGVLRGLGLKAAIPGDQLCLLIRRTPGAVAANAAQKQTVVTSHYGSTPFGATP